MDYVSKRYANPFDVLSLQIEMQSCASFITDLQNIQLEEQVWEVWIHKCMDKGFDEFRRMVMQDVPQNSTDHKADIEFAVKSSREVLAQF